MFLILFVLKDKVLSFWFIGLFS